MAHRSGNENKNACIVVILGHGSSPIGRVPEPAEGHPLLDVGAAAQKICRAHSPFSFELNFIERQGVLPGSDN